jgi:hypothetical protein
MLLRLNVLWFTSVFLTIFFYMKKLILSISLAMLAFGAVAQSHQHNYNKSVFYEIKPNARAHNETAVAAAKAKFPGWSVFTDKYSGEPTDIYGKSVAVPGTTLKEKGSYVLANMLPGIIATEWVMTKAHTASKADYVNYTRRVEGHDVKFSSISLRFGKDGKLVRAQVKAYGNQLKNNVSVPASGAEQSRELTADIEGIQVKSQKAKPDWVWFPVPVAGGYELHPAWHVVVDGKTDADGSVPLLLNCFVDATNGKLLYRNNSVKEAFDVTVKGNVYKTSILNPATQEPLPNLLVSPGFTSLYTDANGVASSPAVNIPVNTNFRLEGLWSMVFDDPSGLVPEASQNITVLGSTYVMPVATRYTSAYYHVNKVHDVMKSYMPGFTDLDFQLPTNVDVGGTCNAFYNGSSINFFAAGGGCQSLAEVADVVYHEYGHGISDFYYQFMGSTWGLENGALHEAFADVWAFGITGAPILGHGAFTNVQGGGSFRRYDELPMIYPRDIQEEVHADGEIIAGAWWDVGVNLGSLHHMMQLFTAVYDDIPDAPNGSEGDAFHQVLVSALLHDDVDANLSNGTPNFNEITEAFARHGIYLPGDVVVAHSDIAHPAANTAITISGDLFAQDASVMTGASLFYRNRSAGTWNHVALPATNGVFSVQVPAQPAGTIVDYYFEVRTINNVVNGRFPLMYDSAAASKQYVTLPYQFAVNVVAKDSNEFEGNVTGWTIGSAPGDNASEGIWINAKPVGSATINGIHLSQMDSDHTSGSGKCLVTGNAPDPWDVPGTADVDNGLTTVITPAFDLSAYAEPIIEYWRWFANSKGSNQHNDAFVAKVGNASSANWKVVDSTFAPDYAWRRNLVAVKSHLTSLNDVQMRFEINDMLVNTVRNNGQSVLDGGVDDFFIYDKKPVGITDPVTLRTEIYPNPADQSIHVKASKAITGSIKLCDVLGKTIAEYPMNGAIQYSIDTKSLTPGTYMIFVQTGSSVQSKKVTVKH